MRNGKRQFYTTCVLLFRGSMGTAAIQLCIDVLLTSLVILLFLDYGLALLFSFAPHRCVFVDLIDVWVIHAGIPAAVDLVAKGCLATSSEQ